MTKTLDRDTQLIIAVKNGDREAFVALFRRYGRPLHHFVCRFVGSTAVAEELVQEIFLKIYRAAPTYEPRGRFTTYLYRVATNHCLNEVRRANYKEKFDSIEESQEQANRVSIELKDQRNPSPDQLLHGKNMTHKLQEFIDELPKTQRAALLLNRLEDLSYTEIADILETSVSAVKSLLHRAKITLRQRLEDWDEEVKTT